jgi:hypothetical protein
MSTPETNEISQSVPEALMGGSTEGLEGGKGLRRVVGTRAQVWHGTAYHTAGGLRKEDLMVRVRGHGKYKRSKIVSKKAHATAKAKYEAGFAWVGHTPTGTTPMTPRSPKKSSKRVKRTSAERRAIAMRRAARALAGGQMGEQVEPSAFE